MMRAAKRSLFPKTSSLASEALDILGHDRFPGQWTGKELNARRLPDPAKAKAAKRHIADEPTNPNPLSEIIGFYVSQDEVLQWPDPDGDDYKSEREARKRHIATCRDLIAALRYGHVNSWLITNSRERIDIPAHWWERPMRLSVGAFLDPRTRRLLEHEANDASEIIKPVNRGDARPLAGKLYVDLAALLERLPTLRLDSVQYTQAPKSKSAASRGRGGRRPGSGSLDAKDAPLLDEMKQLIETKDVQSVWAAAEAPAKKAKGGGTPDSKRRRLFTKYRKRKMLQGG